MNDKALTGSSFACVHYLTVWHLADVAHYLSITLYSMATFAYVKTIGSFIVPFSPEYIFEMYHQHEGRRSSHHHYHMQSINTIPLHFSLSYVFIFLIQFKNISLLDCLRLIFVYFQKFHEYKFKFIYALLFSRGISAYVLKATRRGSGARISAPFENFDFIFIHLYVLFTYFFCCCAFVEFSNQKQDMVMAARKG